MDFNVVLVEPEHSGNVGAVARVMKNFGFFSLVIVRPKCNILSDEAISRSKHARDVLYNATITKKLNFRGYDYVIGTTAKTGSDYNLLRIALAPRQAFSILADRKGKAALVMGREGIGLKKAELEKCDIIVRIPSSEKYPTLNLSHALAILLYELSSSSKKETMELCTGKDKQIILDYINEILNNLSFATRDKKETQVILWRKVIGRMMLTKREAFGVMGLLRKISKAIKKD